MGSVNPFGNPFHHSASMGKIFGMDAQQFKAEIIDKHLRRHSDRRRMEIILKVVQSREPLALRYAMEIMDAIDLARKAGIHIPFHAESPEGAVAYIRSDTSWSKFMMLLFVETPSASKVFGPISVPLASAITHLSLSVAH